MMNLDGMFHRALNMISSCAILTKSVGIVGTTRLAMLRIGLIDVTEVSIGEVGPLQVTRGAGMRRVMELTSLMRSGWSLYASGSAELSMERDKAHYSAPSRLELFDPYACQLIEKGWEFSKADVSKNGTRFFITADLCSLYETFECKVYSVPWTLQSKLVVDVGASIGDTAVYFALQGARVIAIEPNVDAVNLAREHVKMNGVEDRVRLVNSAVCYNTGTDYTETCMECSLSAIIGTEQPFLLKLDCEGCEFDVVRNDYDSLLRFSVLLIEWHEFSGKGSLRDLVRILQRDFYVEVLYGAGESLTSRPRLNQLEMGMIRALRKDFASTIGTPRSTGLPLLPSKRR